MVSQELKRARQVSRLSPTQLARKVGRAPSTVTRIESGETQPTFELGVQLFDACGFRLVAEPTDPNFELEQLPMPSEPTTYPNPRGNNPWDNDTVNWLFEQPGVAARCSIGTLMECLRRQPGRVRNQPQRVADVETLARSFGVEQRKVHDASVGKDMVRLVRTDPGAPLYPW